MTSLSGLPAIGARSLATTAASTMAAATPATAIKEATGSAGPSPRIARSITSPPRIQPMCTTKRWSSVRIPAPAITVAAAIPPLAPLPLSWRGRVKSARRPQPHKSGRSKSREPSLSSERRWTVVSQRLSPHSSLGNSLGWAWHGRPGRELVRKRRQGPKLSLLPLLRLGVPLGLKEAPNPLLPGIARLHAPRRIRA
jgi:hypothetical protein